MEKDIMVNSPDDTDARKIITTKCNFTLTMATIILNP